jgi:tripartite-type tricarboxylate transporter receptor subunit TctC
VLKSIGLAGMLAYTLITGHMGTHAASVALYPNLAYNPATDFEPIGLIAGTPILILARKDFPAKDLKGAACAILYVAAARMSAQSTREACRKKR